MAKPSSSSSTATATSHHNRARRLSNQMQSASAGDKPLNRLSQGAHQQQSPFFNHSFCGLDDGTLVDTPTSIAQDNLPFLSLGLNVLKSSYENLTQDLKQKRIRCTKRCDAFDKRNPTQQESISMGFEKTYLEFMEVHLANASEALSNLETHTKQIQQQQQNPQVLLPLAKKEEQLALNAFYKYTYHDFLRQIHNNADRFHLDIRLTYLERKIKGTDRKIVDALKNPLLKVQVNTSQERLSAQKLNAKTLAERDAYFKNIYQQYAAILQKPIINEDAHPILPPTINDKKEWVYRNYLEKAAFRNTIFFCLQQYIDIKKNKFDEAKTTQLSQYNRTGNESFIKRLFSSTAATSFSSYVPGHSGFAPLRARQLPSIPRAADISYTMPDTHHQPYCIPLFKWSKLTRLLKKPFQRIGGRSEKPLHTSFKRV